MKKTALFLARLASLAALASQTAFAGPSTGDLAFTSFNADEDGWSLVTFVDLAANTRIFFSDGTASNATTIGSNESSFQWLTGAAVIKAGTVVRFSAIDAANRSVSVGSFSVINSSNLGLSATAETVYAFLGTSATSVTTMLTAASSEANTSSLTTVGLTAGVNAVKLTSSTDYAAYTGIRAGQASFAAYQPLVNNAANWAITTTGDNDGVIPSSTAFTVSAVPEPETYALMLSGLLAIGFMARKRRG